MYQVTLKNKHEVIGAKAKYATYCNLEDAKFTFNRWREIYEAKMIIETGTTEVGGENLVAMNYLTGYQVELKPMTVTKADLDYMDFDPSN